MRLTSLGLSFLLIAGVVLGQPPPINDECSSSFPLVVGHNPFPNPTFSPYTNVGATTSAGFAPTCSQLNSDVWFSFVAPASCSYTIDTNPIGVPSVLNLTDTVLAIYASCSSPNYLACDDDS